MQTCRLGCLQPLKIVIHVETNDTNKIELEISVFPFLKQCNAYSIVACRRRLRGVLSSIINSPTIKLQLNVSNVPGIVTL